MALHRQWCWFLTQTNIDEHFRSPKIKDGMTTLKEKNPLSAPFAGLHEGTGSIKTTLQHYTIFSKPLE